MPASVQSMAAKTVPTRILTVDIEQPLPDLRADNRYGAAWVVMCRHGAPRSMAMLDLAEGASSVRRRLEEMVASTKASAPAMRDRPPLPDSSLPRISVVVPTIVARLDDLGKCIEAIGRLDYPNFEVLLIDNRRIIPEPDPLPLLVQDRPWLRVVREPKPGISQARNTGLAHADGEVIAYTDDDVQVDANWLRAIGTRLASEPHLDAVTGLVLPTELETPAQIWFEHYYGGFAGQRIFTPVTLKADPDCQRLVRGSRVLVHDPDGVEVRRFTVYGVGAYGAGSNMAFRRSSLARINGFNTALGTGTPSRGGEDLAALILILWTGGQLGYEPAAFIYHRHRRGYSELLTQLEGCGLGFTAMLTSLVWSDPRHLLCIFSKSPSALRAKAAEAAQRIRGKRPGADSDPVLKNLFPKTLYRRETLAYLRGPGAYLRSQVALRRASSDGTGDDRPLE